MEEKRNGPLQTNSDLRVVNVGDRFSTVFDKYGKRRYEYENESRFTLVLKDIVKDKQLKAVDFAVFLSILTHRYKNKISSFVKYEQIMEENKIKSNKTVQRAIDKLVEKGYIRVYRRRRSNEYNIMSDKIKQKWDGRQYIKVSNDIIMNKKLNSYEKRLFCAFLMHFCGKRECNPSIRGLADKSNMADRTVQKVIKILQDKGLILQFASRRNVNNKYGLL